VFEVGNECFSFVGKTVLDPGFTSLMPWQAIPEEESLPVCEVGQKCAIKEACYVIF